MTSDPYSHSVRYASLRDYLNVLRRYGLVIILIAIVGAGAGYITAKRQTPVYTATAAVAFQDPTQNLSIVGISTPPVGSPAQLAAVAAETATRPTIMIAVKAHLRTGLSVGALSGAIGAVVSQTSSLLDITAAETSPSFAAALANAVAGQLVAQDNRATQRRFAAIAADVRGRIALLRRSRSSAAVNSTPLLFYQDELARLSTLIGYAKSAQVADPAQPSSTAVSPTPVRSAVIGLVLGLLLGIAAAFVRDSIDRRLRSRHDVEGSLGLPVIGHVRNQTMGKVVYMSNGSGGADAQDLESFRILRRNLELLDDEKPSKSVLVTSALAEEGKTTVATSLALALAAAGKTTLLVDCDLRRPDLAGRLGVEQSPGISEYLAGAATPPDILRTITFAEPSIPVPQPSSENGAAGMLVHRLVCIPAGAANSRSAELLSSPRFSEFIEQVTSQYDAVVLDSSPLLPVADTLEMLPFADSVIVCVREARTTRDQASAVRSVLSRVPRRPAGIVLTGIKPGRAEYEVYEYSHSYS